MPHAGLFLSKREDNPESTDSAFEKHGRDRSLMTITEEWDAFCVEPEAFVVMTGIKE